MIQILHKKATGVGGTFYVLKHCHKGNFKMHFLDLHFQVSLHTVLTEFCSL